jgi:TATA-binding protein-associated factor
VLTGTPVHSSVGDLWGLFNFALPGSRGCADAFRRGVVAPVARGRGAAASSGEAAAAGAALAALHRALLPFVLRRLKGHVLSELPPKVVTDVPVELTPVQGALYAALARSSALREATWRGVRLRELGSELSLLTQKALR